MGRKVICFLLILFCAQIASAGTYEEELQGLSLKIAKNIERSGKRTVAVVDFTDLQGNVTELGRFIAEELSANLVSLKKGFRVIDRLHLKSIIAEHKLSTSWFLEPKAVEKFGKISGVDAIVTGTVTPFGDSVRVSAKVITTDTAEVIAAATGNIAKTKAIEGLLARGIETTGAAPLKPKPFRPVEGKKKQKFFQKGNLRITVKSFKKSAEEIKVVLVYENTGDESIRVSFCGGSSVHLLDENGERWELKAVDTAGIWNGTTILAGERLPTKLIFSPKGSANGHCFSLIVHHCLPKIQMVIQDLVPE